MSVRGARSATPPPLRREYGGCLLPPRGKARSTAKRASALICGSPLPQRVENHRFQFRKALKFVRAVIGDLSFFVDNHRQRPHRPTAEGRERLTLSVFDNVLRERKRPAAANFGNVILRAARAHRVSVNRHDAPFRALFGQLVEIRQLAFTPAAPRRPKVDDRYRSSVFIQIERPFPAIPRYRKVGRQIPNFKARFLSVDTRRGRRRRAFHVDCVIVYQRADKQRERGKPSRQLQPEFCAPPFSFRLYNSLPLRRFLFNGNRFGKNAFGRYGGVRRRLERRFAHGRGVNACKRLPERARVPFGSGNAVAVHQ